MSSEGKPVTDSSTSNESGPGNLIVVSAPSGAGKSTLIERVLACVDRLRYSVSYTTRKARGTEQHGVDYYFVSQAEFLAKRERGDFLESAEVHDFFYGTERAATEHLMSQGYDLILDIDVQGAEQIRRQMPAAVTVFVLPPSRQALESRLRMRNLNEPADIERRLQNAAGEVRAYAEFKYVIVNDNLEKASARLEAIIVAERQRPERQSDFAQSIIETFGGENIHA